MLIIQAARSFWIFVVCYLSYCSIYVARLNLSMATPALTGAGLFTVAEIGLLGGIFSGVYAVGRFLSGIIGDRVKPWIVISTGLAVAGICNILFGYFPPIWGSIILWCGNAFAQSMLWGVILRIISCVYPPEKAGKKASQMVTSVTMGNILSIIASAYFVNRFGVAYAFVIPGGITLLCGFFVVLATRKINCPSETTTQLFPIVQLVKQKEIRGAIYPAFLHGIIKDNLSFWMVAFFATQFGVDLGNSSRFVLFIPVVGFIGRTIYPLIYGWFHGKEHNVSLTAFVVVVGAVLLLLLFPRNAIMAMTGLGIIYAAVSIINTSFLTIMPLRYAEDNHIASVSGIMDFATYLGASVGSFVYGAVIERLGYTPVFVSWLVVSVVAILLIKRLKNNKS